MCGQTVQVLVGDHWKNIHFVGFTNLAKSSEQKTASIIGLTGYTEGDQIFGKWQELCSEDILLGCFSANGVELVIENMSPIILGRYVEKPQNQNVNNIVSIFADRAE